MTDQQPHNDDGDIGESLNFSLDGSECTIELIMELNRVIGQIKRGELVLPHEISAEIERLIERWAERQEPDREVGTLIDRIVRLQQENRELRGER